MTSPKVEKQHSSKESRNVLFVCTMNRWRSPRAEKLYERDSELNVRSRGISRKAFRSLGSCDLQWADTVLVMEQKHLRYLQTRFPEEVRSNEVHVLDIPDEYQFRDAELITELRLAIESVLLRHDQD